MSWKRFFLRRRWDEERARELQSYIDIEADQNVARGMSAEDAHCAARRKFGNPWRVREEIYRMNTIGFLETLVQDLRYALRGFRMSRGFSIVAILSLALGIGANTAIFSLLNQVLLQSLPVKEPQQLVLFHAGGPNSGNMVGPNTFSFPMYRDLRDQNTVFNGVAARFAFPANVATVGPTERVHGELVSGNYFQVLGVQPLIGHVFAEKDDLTAGAAPFAVLSYGYWQRHFGGNASVLGQSLTVNGQPLTVIGITPPDFFGMEVGNNTDVFVPVAMKAKMTPGWDGLADRRDLWLDVFARFKPGVSSQTAEAGMNVLFHQILQSEVNDPRIPADPKQRQRFVNKHLSLVDGGRGLSPIREHFSSSLVLLMGFVALVLLSACANVANLLMAKGAARQKEIAIRLALGAARPRVVRQLLVESLVLSFCGGALGIGLAVWLGSGMLRMLPVETNTLTLYAQPDYKVLLFTLAISVLTGIIFGLAPALQLTRPALAPTLKSEANATRGSNAQARTRKLLVIAQTALSLLLVIGAGLFARSLYNLRMLDPGFQPDHLIEFSIDPYLSGYDDPREIALAGQLQQQLRSMPGVKSVSAGENLILAGSQSSSTITVEGYQDPHGGYINPNTTAVAPEYFSTLGIPVILGREFTWSDSASAAKTGIINEKAWRQWFGGKNPIGRHFGIGSRSPQNIEIVGVVHDSRTNGLREEVPCFVYIPFMQDKHIGQLTFFVRTNYDEHQTASSIPKVVQQVDSAMPVFALHTVPTTLEQSLYVERMVAMLSSFFAGLAALLASVGLYGLMAFIVARRTNEIGIRLALGASRAEVIWLVMKEVAWMTCLGVAVALPVAIGLSRAVQSQLYGLTGSDPLTIVVATAIMASLALLAGVIPATKASRIDPIRALRYE